MPTSASPGPTSSGASVDPLLETKLHVRPPRSSLVSRPRLLALLDQGLAGPLTLVSAPAGFGKTTLLAEWLTARSYRSCWLSLDSADNDPSRFLSYLIAALQTVAPGMADDLVSSLRSPEPPSVNAVATTLVNQLASVPEDLVLVLDDYHVITSAAVSGALTYLLESLPPNVHLIVATRSDPSLPIARLRARAQVVEVRADKLRFTPDEAALFLAQTMGLVLSPEQVAALEERTEGWIAGLQMAALSMRGRDDVDAFIRAFAGTNRYILDFLVEEVLSREPEEVQRFLLQTSILSRLSGPLCDAVTERADGQAMLERLERSNLFVVPLDEERYWYRYHHLFADLLRSRLVQSFGDGHIRALHSQAATWHQANHLLAEAVEHALAAHETERAGRLIEDIADSAWLSGGFYQVIHWIEALPAELMRSRPWLCVWYAWSRLQAGTVHGVEELIDNAERGAGANSSESLASGPASDPVPDPVEDEALSEQIAALRVTCAGLRQETDKTIDLAGRALERPVASSRAASLMARSNVLNVLGFAHYMRGGLSESEQAYGEAKKIAQKSGFVLRQLLVVHKLAHVYQVTGRLLEAYQLYQETLADLRERGQGSLFAAGYLYCGMSHLLYEWNRLDEVQQMIARSHRLNELAQVPHLTIDICQAQTRLLLAQADVAGAQAAFQKADHLIQGHYCWPEVVSASEDYRVRLWVANGDIQSVDRWAAEWVARGDTVPEFRNEQHLLTLARALLALDRAEQAAELLGRMRESATRGGRLRRSAEILALLAKARQTIGQSQRAAEALEGSLALAAPMGCVRLFLDEGPELSSLVAAVTRTSRLTAKAQKLALQILAASPEYRPEASLRSGSAAAHSPIEPLSERELEVLGLMALGLKNEQIASRLTIAIGTVKAHIHSISGKLDAQNRAHAVARARELGLL